ncbi:hypothetical protein TIFTF001_033616 [Ficus carica]|uniref:Uncharacterized protein n=1 Tax=Ficus carica TaxID=3494 RepID=A0AA88J838_FICCA|nr:hypothetical protein TIFTF001_033616 [Ficus carica]
MTLGSWRNVYAGVKDPNPSSDGETLVSKEGVFELGFFSPGTSKKRYMGIWYKNIPVQTVVGVANRCNPIYDSSGLLTVNSTGNLVLLYQNKSVVWSTSLFKQVQKPTAQLLDSGNLILGDDADRNSGTYLRQSFDYPSNMFLSDMKMGWDLRTGLKRQITAWNNPEDPCPGNLTYGIQFDPQLNTIPEGFLRKGLEKLYRSGPWNGLRFSGGPELRPNFLYNFKFVYNDDEMYYTYNIKIRPVISILVVNQFPSMIQQLTWIDADQTWRPDVSQPRQYCDNYGICGANGICDISNSPSCQCLRGFRPNSAEKQNSMDWSEGCVRNNPPSFEERDKDGFVKLSGLKLPDDAHSWMNTSMNLKECKAKCSSNCSCTAYANIDIRGEGSGCAIWFGDLIDIWDVLGWILHWQDGIKKRITPENGGREVELELMLIDLSTLATATQSFSMNNKLGEGGFGPGYKGVLEDGKEIAVKRLSMSSGQAVDEFKNEVVLIAKLQHRNLVKLLDFGMVRTFRGDQLEGNTNRVVGTYGYIVLEYAFNGQFSIKSDVFSFGIMVLENAWKLMKAGREIELLDACLRDSHDSFEVLRCIHVGLLCVQQCPAD